MTSTYGIETNTDYAWMRGKGFEPLDPYGSGS